MMANERPTVDHNGNVVSQHAFVSSSGWNECIRCNRPERHEIHVVRPNLEDLYTQLDAAIEAVTALSVTAIAVLPLDLQRACERSLRLLLDVKDRVNPGPDPDGPF